MSIATRFWTYTDLLAKVERDGDYEGEEFIQPLEYLGLFNEAIDSAEQIIHGLYEDYFLDHDTITLVSGTSEYVLPSRIYAQKIRAVMYRNGTRAYEVKRVRDWKKFIQYTADLVGGAQSSAEYQYFMINQSAGAPKALFTPAVNESGAFVEVWFLRQANRLLTGADVLDIPEAANYILQYVKTRCYEKEGHPNLVKAVGDLARERSDLEGVLSTMTPDADNEIELDTSFYGDMN